MQQIETPTSRPTKLYNLPLEMLDMLLQKSYLHWTLHSSTKQSDEKVIRSLMAIDVCFYKRITRQRFKKAIWRYLKEFYGKTKKISAIIRNNRNYLLDNIQPSDELIAYLLSLKCITEEEGRFIQRQRSKRDKNDKLLYIVKSIDETMFSNFVKCLRHTNQKIVADIIENGGGVIRMQVANYTPSKSPPRHQNSHDLRDKTKPWSSQTEKLIVQGLEILCSQLDRQIVVVWIWCHSQEALEMCQILYESNQLISAFVENIRESTSKVINIDRNQFKKTVVVRPLSINFTRRIEKLKGRVRGMTKLRQEIHILWGNVGIISVFEDRNPFRLQREIIQLKNRPTEDIGCSEKDNCLYICDSGDGNIKQGIWKITREKDEYKTIKWLTTEYVPQTLSVSGDGHLLMIRYSPPSLVIYRSDAELIRSIPLPADITHPRHAVKTFTGNFVVIHVEEEGGKMMLLVREMNRDGQMVNRGFIASNEPRQLDADDYYISLDSADRVFVADASNDRVILLDSDLKRNRILCSTKEETDERRIRRAQRLYYDEEMRQLIVSVGSEVNVYTLSRN